jgi:hypothetical protein
MLRLTHRQRRQRRHSQRNHQSQDKQRARECGDSTPSRRTSEKAAAVSDDAGTEIVEEQIKRRRLAFGVPRSQAHPTAGYRVSPEETKRENSDSSNDRHQGVRQSEPNACEHDRTIGPKDLAPAESACQFSHPR